jgi:MFS superfamily sulfate permease-like transporter
MEISRTSQDGRAPWVRFDRHELAGAFGDLGTDLPLLIALITTSGLDAGSVAITFGLLQIGTGLLYGLPMPVQPLKAMAAIMLAGRLSAGTLAGGGLVVGATMLVLACTGWLGWLARTVPKEVVRGIQLGLGITLAMLALKQYLSADGTGGYVFAALSLAGLLALKPQRRVPGPLVVVGLGMVIALVTRLDLGALRGALGFHLPTFRAPSPDELTRGALVLALPQIPLSLANSVIATSQTASDLFPERSVSVRKIGITYGLMNLVVPWLGGVPVCHGCGGLVGFSGFGARTGGAPVLYGSMYLIAGLVFAPGLTEIARVFPLPLLGVVLLFEAVGLMMLVRDVAADRSRWWIALAVAAAAVGLPYGFAVGLGAGTAIAWGVRRGWLRTPGAEPAE